MTRLSDLEKQELTETDFESYPVWVWNESEDALCPIDDYNPLPTAYGTLFIKAQFTTTDGHQFPGYLMGITKFYGCGLFVGGREFVINLNTPDFTVITTKDIAAQLGIESIKLFPLKYQSWLNFKDGGRIEGVLQL
jgi:hypothetical protein